MANAVVQGGGFVVTIEETVATTGDDKGKVTAFGTATVYEECGENKPTYKTQDEAAASDEKIEYGTGTGVTLTAPKKTTKHALSGSSSTSTTGVVDEYELTIINASPENLLKFNGYRDTKKQILFLIGYGYDVNNSDLGFEAIQATVIEVSRGTAPNTFNVLTVKIKGVVGDWASTVTHSTLNTKIGTVGDSGKVTPIAEVNEVDLTQPSSRQFDADDVTFLKTGRILVKN